MGMSDEPWEILKRRPAVSLRYLSPSEAVVRFGPLQGHKRDGLFDMPYYLSFDMPEGRWDPKLDSMKRLTGYTLTPRKRLS